MSGLDRDPGLYDFDGSATALIDQQRAEALDALRTADAVAITWLDKTNGGTHWAIYTREDEAASEFLLYVLCKAWRDARAVLGWQDDSLADLVKTLVAEGVGE